MTKIIKNVNHLTRGTVVLKKVRYGSFLFLFHIRPVPKKKGNSIMYQGYGNSRYEGMYGYYLMHIFHQLIKKRVV